MATSVMSRGRPAVVSPGCVTVVVQWPDREWRARRDPSSSPVHWRRPHRLGLRDSRRQEDSLKLLGGAPQAA